MMHIKPRILTALVLGVYSAASWAMHPFVVRDIRVEGIQRTEPGTRFKIRIQMSNVDGSNLHGWLKFAKTNP